MTITVGSTLPDATLLKMGDAGSEPVSMAAKLKGRNVVIFGLPGAYTGTCTTSHVPSFMRVVEKLTAKGVNEVICLAVNDPFVMQAWGESTGAADKGITFLGDGDASFTKAIGMEFSVPHLAFFDRSKRYALYAVDGVVQVLNIGPESDACEISGGEAMLEAI
ncbi:MAG: peroxiredoxin [Candidatus Saccharibacteria bacterium]|nr:peroxiredoxin [Pseudorhodobacter sp.]